MFRGSLSKPERKAYTDAVLCLQKLPAKTPRSLVPGVRSRYDDFLATHINQTLNIHYTVSRRALVGIISRPIVTYEICRAPS